MPVPRIGCHSRVWLSRAAAGIIHCQQQPGLAPPQLWGLVHGTSTCTGRQHGQEEEEVLCSRDSSCNKIDMTCAEEHALMRQRRSSCAVVPAAIR